jgi:hypothetical protein
MRDHYAYTANMQVRPEPVGGHGDRLPVLPPAHPRGRGAHLLLPLHRVGDGRALPGNYIQYNTALNLNVCYARVQYVDDKRREGRREPHLLLPLHRVGDGRALPGEIYGRRSVDSVMSKRKKEARKRSWGAEEPGRAPRPPFLPFLSPPTSSFTKCIGSS